MVFILVLIFASSCAKQEVEVRHYEIRETNINAKWFKGPNRFSHRGTNGEIPLHPFFDYKSNADMRNAEINFVVTTPKGSDYFYGFDLVSGKSYRNHKLCSQEDIWQKYEGGIHRPNFTDGFIPRQLDQLGYPQRIIVFGKSQYLSPISRREPTLESARIVGGVVEQFCKSFPCSTRDKWLSRLVLVGVMPNDPQFQKIRTLTALKKVIDWDYTKAYLENGRGRTFEGDKQLPAFRVVGNSGPKNALSFSINNGYQFDDQSVLSMRDSCRKLYDFIWKSQNDIREYNRKKLNPVDDKPKVNKLIGRFRDAEVRTRKKKVAPEVDGMKRSFAVFMNVFYQKYVDRYKTCQKYVRSTNLNQDSKRHWFFAFLEAFVKLEDQGYVYKCNRRAWIENPLMSSGRRMFSPQKERRRCTNAELDRAFDMTATVFSGLQRSNNEHYQYVQYDEGRGGSHQKLYSWVYHNGKRLGCFDREDNKLLATDKLVFPRDVNWRPFSIDSRKNLFDIIR